MTSSHLRTLVQGSPQPGGVGPEDCECPARSSGNAHSFYPVFKGSCFPSTLLATALRWLGDRPREGTALGQESPRAPLAQGSPPTLVTQSCEAQAQETGEGGLRAH